MLRRCLSLVLACQLCTGCLLPPLPVMAPGAPTANATRSAPASPPMRPPVRQSITLAYGETDTVADGLALTFQDVLEDSRCPADVMCAWSGWVRIQLLVQPPNEAATTVVITSFTDSKGNTETHTGNQEAQPFAKVGKYLIELKQVTPYPAKHDEPIPLEAYQVVIQVHQQQVQPVPTVAPTVAPTSTMTGSANCPEAPQLPVLCYSNQAITEYAAGMREEPPLLPIRGLAPESPARIIGEGAAPRKRGLMDRFPKLEIGRNRGTFGTSGERWHDRGE